MKKLFIILLAVASVTFYSCETEVDILGDYKETTIVYGLLNQDSTTFVKVNKAFLGKGNALTMAKIEDSSTFNNITVQMLEMDEDELVRTINLHDTVIDYKEDGIFYNPYQKLYYSEAELNQDYNYELKVSFEDENKEDVTASTELIHNLSVSRPPVSVNTVNFMTDSPFTTIVRWNHAVNAYYYQVIIRFNYKEKFVDQADTVYRHMDWEVGTVLAENEPYGSEIELNYFPDTFYDLCAERIPYQDAAKEQQVLARRSDGIEFIFQVASEEFYTYLEVNGASGSIVQDKPQYTNVENGLGLFASRYNKKLSKNLHVDTQFALEKMDLRFTFEAD